MILYQLSVSLPVCKQHYLCVRWTSVAQFIYMKLLTAFKRHISYNCTTIELSSEGYLVEKGWGGSSGSCFCFWLPCAFCPQLQPCYPYYNMLYYIDLVFLFPQPKYWTFDLDSLTLVTEAKAWCFKKYTVAYFDISFIPFLRFSDKLIQTWL